MCIWRQESFSQDHYSYFELSKTIFTDFAKINTYRQYILFTDYGISFPYLYPLLIAIFNQFTGLGMYNGFLINVIFVVLTAVLLPQITARIWNTHLAGAIGVLFLLGNTSYSLGVQHGGTFIPVIFCSLILLERLLALPFLSQKELVVAGLAAGAAVVFRFDALVTSLGALIIIFLFSPKKRFHHSAIFFLALLVFTLPWIIFSLSHFGQPWISDNGGTALLVQTTNPLRFFSPDYTPQTLFSHPELWIQALLTTKAKHVFHYGFFGCFVYNGCISFALWWLYLVWKSRFSVDCIPGNKTVRILMGAIAVLFLLKFSMYWVVGYGDRRYHIESWLLIVIFLTAVLIRLPKKNLSTVRLNCSVILLATVFASVVISAPLIDGWTKPQLAANYKPRLQQSHFSLQESTITIPDHIQELMNAVTRKTSTPRVASFGRWDDRVLYAFGAYSGLPTFPAPIIFEDDHAAFAVIYNTYIKPDFFVLPAESENAEIIKPFGLVPVLQTKDYIVYEVTIRPCP